MSPGFIESDSRYLSVVFYSLWGLILFLTLVSVYMLVSSLYFQQDNETLEEQVALLEMKLEKNKTMLRGAPSLEEFRQLQQRIRVINQLAGQQGNGLSSVLASLETLLPDSAYVTSLTYKPEKNELLLTLEAPGATELTQLLHAIEKSGHFSKVLLTRQAQEKREGKRFIQFDMRLLTLAGKTES